MNIYLDCKFTSPESVAAYVNRTNEKRLLQNEIKRAFLAGEMPIRMGDRRKRVLDLGCGLGTHLNFLSHLFREQDVAGIDREDDFVVWARQGLRDAPNISLERSAFEDYHSKKFDFILCSHVLQYIDTELLSFVDRMVECLRHGGELWIVLHKHRGLNQLLRASIPFVNTLHPHLANWFIHDDLRAALQENTRIAMMFCDFVSRFLAPEPLQPSLSDSSMLDFLLLGGFDIANIPLKMALANEVGKLSSKGSIQHDVGITKIRRVV